MIITDEKALRVKCTDVLPDEVGAIREALESELKHSEMLGNPGIGLAAPQIGIAKNMAIVRIPNNHNYLLDVDLVNCKIANGYDKKIFESEGCLSYPGRYERTLRWQEIHVINNMVGPNSFIVTGLMAVACQHELDHLSGILLPDICLPEQKIKIVDKVGPNEPCPCGARDSISGKAKKFKKCHMMGDPATLENVLKG